MEKRYAIGEAYSISNITVKTLRYYDDIGLIKPEHRAADSKYRYYSKRQLTTLLVIRRLRSQGFSIKDIKELISRMDIRNLRIKMEKHIKELESEINLLTAKKESCESILTRVRRGEEVICENEAQTDQKPLVRIEEIPSGTMLYLREIMPQYNNADVSLNRWTDIYERCNSKGIHMKSPVIVTFFDHVLEQFLTKDCDVEFGILIDPSGISTDASDIHEFGGFTAATLYHVGEYREIIKSHVELLQWINQNGFRIAGPVSEEFIISPLDIDDDSLHVTKIIIPVEKAPRL